jgi:hypothetical protein
MIFGDKKKLASIMSGKMGSDKLSPLKPEHETDENKAALQMIAEDIIAAFDQKSASDLAASLKAFFVACEAYEDSSEED